jgi:hypothetical protein
MPGARAHVIQTGGDSNRTFSITNGQSDDADGIGKR